MTEPRIPEFECVDPQVGDRVFELPRPGLEPEDRRVIEAHLEVCAFCREAVDLDQRLAARFRPRRRRGAGRVRPRWLGVASLATAAAAAFCMMALPPRPVGPTVAIRGDDAPRFVRPVEGEVVLAGELSASWTPIEGADAYEVRLSEVDGEGSWTAETGTTQWRAGEDVELTAGRSYRLILSTTPPDLLAPGETSVRFVAGSPTDLVTHRVKRAQPIAYGLLFSALVFGIYAVSARKRRV